MKLLSQPTASLITFMLQGHWIREQKKNTFKNTFTSSFSLFTFFLTLQSFFHFHLMLFLAQPGWANALWPLKGAETLLTLLDRGPASPEVDLNC